MSSNSLDSLAANGIISFDADSYVKGTKPRFVGNPESGISSPLQQASPAQSVTPGEKLSGEPVKDAFVKREDENEHKGSSLAKILTGAAVGALAVFTGMKIRSGFTTKKSAKAEAKNTEVSPETKTTTKENKKGFFTKCKETITSWFDKSKKQVEEATEKVKKSAEEVAKDKKGALSKLPKGVKIVAAGIIGLLGLYGLYNVTSKNKQYTPE